MFIFYNFIFAGVVRLDGCVPLLKRLWDLGEIDGDALVVAVEATNAAAEGSKWSIVQPRRRSNMGFKTTLLQA